MEHESGKEEYQEKAKETEHGALVAAHAPVASLPPFDAERYRKYVESFDLTPDQQTELLRTLWSMMVTMVDIGFGVDSVQRLIPALAEFSTENEGNELNQRITSEQFNNAASQKAEKDDES